MRNNRAITLVALIITVIILLILAGVVIAMTIGDEGIINKSQQAVNKYDEATVREKVTIILAEYKMESINSTKTLEEYLNEQKVKGELDEVTNNGDGTIIVEVDGYKIIITESNLSIKNEEIRPTDEIQYKQGLKYAYNMKTIDEYIENAAEFNGSNYLKTENIGSAYTGTNSKTLSIWFKTNIITNGISGFAGIGTDGSKTGFLCGVKDGYLYFDTGLYNFIRCDTDFVADGMWHNFTVSYDKNETRISLYLDGNKIYTDTGEINITDGPLLIGKSFQYCFNGSIASVRLYDRAISTAEASNLYNEGWKNYSSTSIKNGLTYEYIMKNNINGVVIDTANSHSITQIGNINYYEKTITNIKDISGNKNDITVNKDLLKNSEGKYFLDFYNQNEYYQTKILDNDYLSTNSKTLMSWFKTDTVTSSINGFVGIGTDGSKTGFLCGVKDGYLYFDTGSVNFSRSGIDYVADGKWHHFAVSYKKETKEIKLYLDGNKIYENTGDINTQKSTLSIGKSFEYIFNGQITNVRLYNISVDADTINNIYNIEK